MSYDPAKVAAQRAAVDILVRAGHRAEFQGDHARYRIAVFPGGERELLFLDGFWDAEGVAEPGTMIGQALQFGEIEAGDLESVAPIRCDYRDGIDWTDPADIAAAILAAIDVDPGAAS